MGHSIPPPVKRPEPGYYYNYKHDPNGPVNDNAFFITRIGCHTSDNCRPQDAYMLIYQPLYESFVFLNGRMFDLKPLQEFYEPAEKDGKPVDRFTKITDPNIIAQLREIKTQMYPDE